MLRVLLALALPFLVLLAPPQALAQDDTEEPTDTDDFTFDKGEEPVRPAEKKDEPKKEDKGDPKKDDKPPPPPPPVDTEDDDIDFDDDDPTKPDPTKPDAPPPRDFLDDDDDADDDALLAPGTDSADIYRAKQDELGELPADEEVMAWEAYLLEYPNTLFRKPIDERIEELVESQFKMRVGRTGSAGGNADEEELYFVQALHLPNANPRTKATLGVLFGAPTYLELNADFEYAFMRRVSAHIGFGSRYAGWGLDLGGRFAFVKSQRLDFVATFTADIGLNFNQRVTQEVGDEVGVSNALFFQARPQLAFGKIVGPVQMILSLGADISSRKNSTVAVIGGLHIAARIAPPFAVFAETDFYVRNIGKDRSPFTFDVLSFGFRFYPLAKKKDDPFELVTGGYIPYATKYLQYYGGAVAVQGVYYPTIGGR